MVSGAYPRNARFDQHPKINLCNEMKKTAPFIMA